MDAPKYNQPGLDPAYGQLSEQTRQQDIAAIQGRIRDDTASLTSRYGALTQSDSASVMARYGAMLSLAGGTGTNPMLAPDPLRSVA